MNEVEKADKRYVFGTWGFQDEVSPTEIVSTDGVRFTTAAGDEYIDFYSQLGCLNLGYSVDEIRESVSDMLDTAPYVGPHYTTKPRATLAKKLAELTPGTLSKTFFSTSGTEANEAAIKMARAFTGKDKLVSFYRSYHGATAGSMSISGDPRRLPSEPGIPGTIKVPSHYEYGSRFDAEKSLEAIEETLEMEGDTIAAVFAEPIIGAGGIVVPPEDYLPKLRSLTREYNALLVFDEVVTGFGRTGEWFASDLFGVTPDIITMAKGLSSAYAPLGATTVSREIADYFEDNMLAHGHTYYGHPVSVAAGLAAVNYYEDHDLIYRARDLGEYLERKLMDLNEAHPCIGEVRGVGMLYGLELTKSSTERVPFADRMEALNRSSSVVGDVRNRALENGVNVLSKANTLLIGPPLTIQQRDIDEAIKGLDDALNVADDAMIA